MRTARRTRTIRFWRRAAQIAVVLGLVLVAVLNLYEINYLSGNLLFFNLAGVPLADPLSVMQVAAGTCSATSSMLLGAGLTLLPALLLGPVFCSWICPFGFFSELAQGNKRGAQEQNTRPLRSAAGKIALVLAGLVAVALFAPLPLLNQLSLPGWYSRIAQYGVLYRDALWGGLAFFCAVLALERLAGKRFWCAYLCPQSLLLALAGMLLPGRLQVRFNRKLCTCTPKDRPCRTACSLRLDPRTRCAAQSFACTNCGDCVDACRKRGRALRFGLGQD